MFGKSSMGSLAVLGLTAVSPAFGVVIEIKELCQDSARHSFVVSGDVYSFGNVGELSVRTFNERGIQFSIHEQYIEQIESSPMGEDAIEFVSPHHVRYYGWCVLLDAQPLVRPIYETPVSPSSRISWYYGYSESIGGVFQDGCQPAWHTNFICH